MAETATEPSETPPHAKIVAVTINTLTWQPVETIVSVAMAI